MKNILINKTLSFIELDNIMTNNKFESMLDSRELFKSLNCNKIIYKKSNNLNLMIEFNFIANNEYESDFYLKVVKVENN